jgi:flavin reductase (DIM6/NTAB) family NADH-FMN oxidoreductase RutF
MSVVTENDEFLSVDAADLSPLQAYQFLVNCVAPRPIALVSTLSVEGEPNLAPFSFFMAGGVRPPSVAIAPGRKSDGEPKDTLRNIAETGEYVINVVSYEMRERMNETSRELAFGISEWPYAGLTPTPAMSVKPARVAESPMAMECRLFQIVRHGVETGAANYVIGEVVRFHVAKRIMVENGVDVRQVDYLSRLGGDWYGRVNADVMFEMPRPSRSPK